MMISLFLGAIITMALGAVAGITATLPTSAKSVTIYVAAWWIGCFIVPVIAFLYGVPV